MGYGKVGHLDAVGDEHVFVLVEHHLVAGAHLLDRNDKCQGHQAARVRVKTALTHLRTSRASCDTAAVSDRRRTGGCLHVRLVVLVVSQGHLRPFDPELAPLAQARERAVCLDDLCARPGDQSPGTPQDVDLARERMLLR